MICTSCFLIPLSSLKYRTVSHENNLQSHLYLNDLFDDRHSFAESIQPPQFTTEIVDARVQEGEEAKFECHYAGNPKPGNPS
jgi:hypothetical protein